jgi:ribosomal protein L34E
MGALPRFEPPLNVREIAGLVTAECGIDVTTPAAAAKIVDSVRAAPSRPYGGLRCEKQGREPMVWWVDPGP